MRWENLLVESEPADQRPTAPLFEQGAVVRTFDTPEFRGMTFFEVRARSIINRVPEASRMPFRWTINPYRGCSHACAYCFARKSHTYLEFDYGRDFERQVVVKVNAPDLLRRELAHPRWSGEHITMGTNVDPYQRAEGRYRLMRGILEALRDFANPFSILTKGTLILRDLDLLAECAKAAEVAANVSVGFLNGDLWRSVEPGTPKPARRLDACRALNEAGVPCGVLIAPVLPFLTDGEEPLAATVRAAAAAGATHAIPIVLHLRRGGSREWFMRWLSQARPELVARYEELYGGAYAPKRYQQEVSRRVAALCRRFGIGRGSPAGARRVRSPVGPGQQLSLV